MPFLKSLITTRLSNFCDKPGTLLHVPILAKGCKEARLGGLSLRKHVKENNLQWILILGYLPRACIHHKACSAFGPNESSAQDKCLSSGARLFDPLSCHPKLVTSLYLRIVSRTHVPRLGYKKVGNGPLCPAHLQSWTNTTVYHTSSATFCTRYVLMVGDYAKEATGGYSTPTRLGKTGGGLQFDSTSGIHNLSHYIA